MRRLILLFPFVLLLGACDRDTPGLYPPDEDSAFAQPNSGKTTGEPVGPPGIHQQPGGAAAPEVTDGAPSTTADPPAGGKILQPGEAAAGGQAAGSQGSASGPSAGGTGTPTQDPKEPKR